MRAVHYIGWKPCGKYNVNCQVVKKDIVNLYTRICHTLSNHIMNILFCFIFLKFVKDEYHVFFFFFQNIKHLF
jgi:hypothetical protein